jgi:hypothetical protein
MTPRTVRKLALTLMIFAGLGTLAGSGVASSQGTTFRVTSSIANKSTISGSVKWTATPSATAKKVEFSIDNTLRWTEYVSPYQFNGDPGGLLDTKTLSNGSHTLLVKAYTALGKVASATSTVTVSNTSSTPPPPPPPYTVSSSVANGSTLSGSVTWTARPSATSTKVEFLIDGTVQWTEWISPYQFKGDPTGVLDTTTLPNATHTLSVVAHASDGRTATASSSVTVSNSTSTQPPPPPPYTVSSSVANGSTLSGSVTWTATPSATTTKVDFVVDGAVKWTDSAAPYQYNGDPSGVLNTTTLTNAGHTLAVAAYASDGRTATASSSVTVSNTTTSPPSSPPNYGSIPRFGIATGYKILNRSAADQNFELDQIKAVGAKIVRFDSLPSNQAQVDAVVAGVLARGLEPMLVLFGTTPPISASTAASFAGAQATKWKGKVRLYEFANEPDLNGWNGTSYAQSLIPAYNAIKTADPNAIVIAGALWKGAGGPVQFVTDMYNAGAKGHFDILSLHLYDDPFASGTWNIWNMAFSMTPSVRSVMDSHGDQAIPIGATEAGGPTSSYGETGQATIVGHDFDALRNNPHLAFVCVYSMMDDDVSGGFGLLRSDRSKRPSWAAYQSGAGTMSTATSK